MVADRARVGAHIGRGGILDSDVGEGPDASDEGTSAALEADSTEAQSQDCKIIEARSEDKLTSCLVALGKGRTSVA